MIQVTGGPGVELTIGMAGSESHQDSICSLLSVDIILRQAFPLMAMRWLLEAPGYKLSSGMRGLPKSCNQSPPVETHFLWLAALGHVPILSPGECRSDLHSGSAIAWEWLVRPVSRVHPWSAEGSTPPKGRWCCKVVSQKKGLGNGSCTDVQLQIPLQNSVLPDPKGQKSQPNPRQSKPNSTGCQSFQVKK